LRGPQSSSGVGWDARFRRLLISPQPTNQQRFLRFWHSKKGLFSKGIFKYFDHIPIEMEEAHSTEPPVISDSDDGYSVEDGFEYDNDDDVWIGPNGEDWCYDPSSDEHYDLLVKLKDETPALPLDYKSLRTLRKVSSVTSEFLSCTHMRLRCYEHWENELKIRFQTGIQPP